MENENKGLKKVVGQYWADLEVIKNKPGESMSEKIEQGFKDGDFTKVDITTIDIVDGKLFLGGEPFLGDNFHLNAQLDECTEIKPGIVDEILFDRDDE